MTPDSNDEFSPRTPVVKPTDKRDVNDPNEILLEDKDLEEAYNDDDSDTK